MNTKLDFIFRRRSIRKFKDQSISSTIIIDLLEAATAAPTAANSEPWEFIVINDHKLLNSIREQFVFAKYNSPLAIVVCGNLKLAFKGPGKDMWIQDCSAASENILLAASALGLGSVWIGIYPLESNIKQLKKLLSIPEEIIPLNIIYLGYPDEEKPPRTRLNMKRVYFNTYDNERKHRTKDQPKRGHY